MEIYVIGHRNPDTDAIISSLAFSYVLRKLGFNANPYRIGDLQPETRVILEKTGLQAPLFINDIRIRARDIMTPNPFSVKIGEPIKRAIDLLVAKSIRSVPVVDDEKRVYGIFSVESFAKFFLKELSSIRLVLRNVPIDNIIKTTNSKILCGSTQGVINGRVYVAASSIEMLRKFSQEMRGQILVVGDRRDILVEALNIGVSTIIITNNYSIDKEVLVKAEEKKITIIVSPYDTYTTLRLLDLSQPVEYYADRPVTVLEDVFVSDVKSTMIREGVRSIIVTDELNRLKGIITRSDLVKDYRKRIALVDHNEFSQSITGIEENIIIAVVDHHRISGDIETKDPIIFRVEPLGSTNTIIWNIAKEYEILFPENIAEAMLYAILSDTLLLRSPTTTDTDRRVVNEILRYINKSLSEAVEFMRIAMAANEPSNPLDIVTRDLKIFNVKNTRFGIAQIFTTRPDNYIHIIKDIRRVMENILREKKLRFLILMITDFIENNSIIISVGEKRIVEKALEVDLSKEYAVLEGVTSRKKQVLPKILEYLERMY